MPKDEPFFQNPPILPSHIGGEKQRDLAWAASLKGGSLKLDPALMADGPSGFTEIDGFLAVSGSWVIWDHRLRTALAGASFVDQGLKSEDEVPFFVDRGMDSLHMGVMAAYGSQGDVKGAISFIQALLSVEGPFNGALVLGPLMAARGLIAFARTSEKPVPNELWQLGTASLLKIWHVEQPFAIWQAGAVALGGLAGLEHAPGPEIRSLLWSLLEGSCEAISKCHAQDPTLPQRWSQVRLLTGALLAGIHFNKGILERLEKLLEAPLLHRLIIEAVLQRGIVSAGFETALSDRADDPGVASKKMAALALLKAELYKDYSWMVPALLVGPDLLVGEPSVDMQRALLAAMGQLPEEQALEVALHLGQCPGPRDWGTLGGCFEGRLALALGVIDPEGEATLDREVRANIEAAGDFGLMAVVGALNYPGKTAGLLAQLLDEGFHVERLLFAIEEGARRRFELEDRDPWMREAFSSGSNSLRLALLKLGELPESMELFRCRALLWLGQGEKAVLEPTLKLLKGSPEVAGDLLAPLGAAQIMTDEAVNVLLTHMQPGNEAHWGEVCSALSNMARGWDHNSDLLERWPHLLNGVLSLGNLDDWGLSEKVFAALWRVSRQRV